MRAFTCDAPCCQLENGPLEISSLPTPETDCCARLLRRTGQIALFRIRRVAEFGFLLASINEYVQSCLDWIQNALYLKLDDMSAGSVNNSATGRRIGRMSG
jgi:hypothetical protein